MGYNHYGRLAAMRRAKKNEQRRLEQLESMPTEKKVKKVKSKQEWIDELSINPLNVDGLTDFKIDWDDVHTTTHANYVVNTLVDENYHAQLVDMPTGTGKTAVAIKSLSLMQEKLGFEIPFIVASTTKTVQKKGWHNTIISHNKANPNNQLKPILITSIDKLANICSDKNGRNVLVEKLGFDGIIVLDEVHKYKNPTSKRSKQLQKLSINKRIGLSASPLANDIVTDIMSYLIIGDFYKNKSKFVEETNLGDKINKFGQYIVTTKDGLISEKLWPEYKIVNGQLHSLIYKPDIDMKSLDMPESTEHIKILEPGNSLKADINSLIHSKNKRMFDSFIDFFMEVVYRIHNDDDRLNELIRIIQKDGTKQPLIFYEHTDVAESIINKFKEVGINDFGVVSGQLDITPQNQNAPVLIQYKSGSEGIEFKNSNTSIFYENQYSYINLLQARGRNVRRGMTGTTKHYYLVFNIPIEKEIFNAVRNKEELNEKVLEEFIVKVLDNK